MSEFTELQERQNEDMKYKGGVVTTTDDRQASMAVKLLNEIEKEKKTGNGTDDTREFYKLPFNQLQLITQIMTKIPPIKNRIFDSEILVVAAVEFAIYLKSIGFKNVTIVNSVHDLTIDKISKKIDISTKDLTECTNMKFDVVVGNPPYQGSCSKDKLWIKFLELAFNVVKDDGYVSLITPTVWTHDKKLYKYFTRYNTIYINIDECKRWFNGVNSEFSYYIIQKTEGTNDKVTIQDLNSSNSVLLPTVPFGNSITNITIMEKIENYKGDRIEVYAGQHTDNKKTRSDPANINKVKFMTEEHKDFKVPVIKSLSTNKINYGWGRTIIDQFEGPRVIGMSMSPGWLAGKSLKVVDSAQCTQSIYNFPTQTMKQATVMESVLMSKLYRFYAKVTSGHHTISIISLRNLPLLDLNRSWTDQQLYTHFKLTNDEIETIESTIK